MEKPAARTKGSKIFRFLPKATSFTVPSTPYSPAPDRWHAHRGFSGPILPMIPAEARRGGAHGGLEPTSPRVTCVGKIKSRKKDACGAKRGGLATWKERRACLAIGGWLFRRRAVRGGRGEDVEVEGRGSSPGEEAAQAPTLGQLKRFASGCEGVPGFEWVARQVAQEEWEDDAAEHTEGEEEEESEEEEEEEEVVVTSHSAPVVVVGGGDVGLEPRKEVNLWRRRTVAPPRPLQV